MHLYLLYKSFRPHIILKLYEALHRRNKKEFLLEFHQKIQQGRHDLLVQGLNCLFLLYKNNDYPTPWEALHHQIKFERTDNYFATKLNDGKYNIKMYIGPAYFMLADSLFFRN